MSILTIEAVAITREDDEEGLRLEWIVEGGISALELPGTVLFASAEGNSMCDEDGSCQVQIVSDFDETIERERFIEWYSSMPFDKFKETMWMAWEAFAKSRAEQ